MPPNIDSHNPGSSANTSGHPPRVGYLGPPGTYSQEAARRYFGWQATLTPYATVDDVLAALEDGRTDAAVLPIENSTEGSVNRTLDLLLHTQAHISGEILLPIRHQLLSSAKSLDDIAEVAAHPQALAQCHDWLGKNLPNARKVAMNSNGEAAANAAKKPDMAAIAGVSAAEIYGLPILAKNIEDDPTNTTRFVVAGAAPMTPTGHDKTSLICSVPNEPGALSSLLSIVSAAGINITKLESRPAKNGRWDYLFYMDIDGHAQDVSIAGALEAMGKQALFVRVLGSYPKASA